MGAETINNINVFFAIGAIIFLAFSLILLIGIITKDKGPFFTWVSKKTLFLVTFVSFSSILGSLMYQYIIGFSPCTLCWYQRIFMYPIGLISIVAIFKKFNSEIWVNVKTLSIIGGIIALYHVLSRFTGKELIPCSATGPSCLQDLFKVFGFIDIPVMSLISFLLIFILAINHKRFS